MRGGFVGGRRGAAALLPSVDHCDGPQLGGGTLRHRAQDRHPTAVPGSACTFKHTQFTAAVWLLITMEPIDKGITK